MDLLVRLKPSLLLVKAPTAPFRSSEPSGSLGSLGLPSHIKEVCPSHDDQHGHLANTHQASSTAPESTGQGALYMPYRT